MSYKLEKPYKISDRIKFIVQYNHTQGLVIEETEKALYALEENEIIKNGVPIINPDYEKQKNNERIKKEIEDKKQELIELDLKRIRAVCENDIKNQKTKETWLEFYNKQALDLRKSIETLEQQIIK